jgi:hypothetical protein
MVARLLKERPHIGRPLSLPRPRALEGPCPLPHRCAMLHHEAILLCVLPAAVPSVGAASVGLSSRSIAPTSPVAVRRLRTRAMTRLAQRDGRGAVLPHKGRHHTDR